MKLIQDYLIEQEGIDWSSALATWHWLLPPEFTLWLVNRIGDLFIVLDDGSVHMLDIGGGTLERVAENRDDFAKKIDENGNEQDWLAIPLVDSLNAAGVRLQPGQCYGFNQLPILGGDYCVENFSPIEVTGYFQAYGSIHEQLRNVPDGTEVRLEVINPPASEG